MVSAAVVAVVAEWLSGPPVDATALLGSARKQIPCFLQQQKEMVTSIKGPDLR